MCIGSEHALIFVYVLGGGGGVEGGVMLILSVPCPFSSYVPLSETLMYDISVELHRMIGL